MTKNCEVCNKPFSVTGKIQALKEKTCSLACRRKRKKCIVCGKKFPKIHNKKACSPDCNRELTTKYNYKRFTKQQKENQKFKSKASYQPLGNGSVKFEDKVLTLRNYKEPLTKIEKSKGFGWYGTVAITLDGSQIQCHICGRFYESLIGHIFNTHKMKTKEYKEQYGLQYTTALVSENIRIKEKQRTLDYIKSLTPEQKEAYKQAARERFRKMIKNKKIKAHGHKKALEAMNKDASCPDQTLDQIKQVKVKIGHVPSKDEFITETGSQRYIHLAYKHFGSWNKAIEMCKFNPKDDTRKKTNEGNKYSEKRYTDEELLEYLRIYAEENRQIPTVTDFRRGLLPNYELYTKRFKTIENARQLAGVYEIISPYEDETFNKSKSKYWRKFLPKLTT